MQKRIVVLVSGSGSNLQAIIDQCQQAEINGRIVAVISNIANAYALTRAKNAGIPAITISHKKYVSRDAFDNDLQLEIEKYNADLIVLAGFMRILSENFVCAFAGKVLNIHPSLLPKYPGLRTHQRAIDNGDTVHGASVHLVTPELDGGPVVIQSQVQIFPSDDADILAKRVANSEWIIYPLAVKWFCNESLTFRNNAKRHSDTSNNDSFDVLLSKQAEYEVESLNNQFHQGKVTNDGERVTKETAFSIDKNKFQTQLINCKIIIKTTQDKNDEMDTSKGSAIN